MIFHDAPAALGNEPESAPLELTLAESIALTLRNNRSLFNARLSRVTQKFDLKVAEDEFWPDVNVNSLVDYDIAWDAERRKLEYNEGPHSSPQSPYASLPAARSPLA